MSNNIYCECLKCPLTLTGAVSVDYLSAAGLTELLDLPCCVVGIFIALSTLEHRKSSTDVTLPGSYAKREGRSLFKKTSVIKNKSYTLKTRMLGGWREERPSPL